MKQYKPIPARKELLVRLMGGNLTMLISVLLTIINIVIAVTMSKTQFLYSLSMPYYAVTWGKAIDNNFAAGGWPINGRYTYIGIAIAAVILAVYVLMVLMSRRHPGWSIAMMVLFCLDMVFLFFVGIFLLENPASIVFEVCIHFWIIFILSRQIWAAVNLRRLDAIEDMERRMEAEKKEQAAKASDNEAGM